MTYLSRKFIPAKVLEILDHFALAPFGVTLSPKRFLRYTETLVFLRDSDLLVIYQLPHSGLWRAGLTESGLLLSDKWAR